MITDVIAEYNQIGYSGTNAGGDLVIVRSVWRKNRTGLVPNRLDSEELAPQRDATIVGNLIEVNGSSDAARSSTEVFDVAYGVGLALVGASDNQILRNHLPGNSLIGIALAPNPGFGENYWPSAGNVVRGNNVHGSALADLAVIAGGADDHNCFADNQYGTSAPLHIEQLMPCEGAGTGDPTEGALDITRFLDTSQSPPGRDYKQTPVPSKQPNMARAKTGKARPAGAPPKVDVDSITRPT